MWCNSCSRATPSRGPGHRGALRLPRGGIPIPLLIKDKLACATRHLGPHGGSRRSVNRDLARATAQSDWNRTLRRRLAHHQGVPQLPKVQLARLLAGYYGARYPPPCPSEATVKKTRLCYLLGIEYPIIQAPMDWIADAGHDGRRRPFGQGTRSTRTDAEPQGRHGDDGCDESDQ